MSTVTRLEWEACDAHNCHCDIVESKDGDMVNYEDYAALEKKLTDMEVQLANAESKCRELAAENAGLKELIEQHANGVAVCPNCSHEEPSETDDIVALYRSMETPATDAFLAEVRAQGVEMFALQQRQIAAEQDRSGDYEFSRHCSISATEACEFAEELREGKCCEVQS
ncbi:hypothetical protein ACK6V0_06690 [Citrobacter braakii]|uniref:hypothetical protein n=1 Tax=Citrobacter braakii TaxID=57706 RepID=UPI003C306715